MEEETRMGAFLRFQLFKPEEKFAVQCVFYAFFPVQNNHLEVGFAEKVNC
jgi:hypothetical protein